MNNLILSILKSVLFMLVVLLNYTYGSAIFNCDFDDLIDEKSNCFGNKLGDILNTGNKLDIIDVEPIPLADIYYVTDVKSITSLTKENKTICDIPFVSPIRNQTQYFCYLNASSSYICKTKLDTYDECTRGKFLHAGSISLSSKYILTYEFANLLIIPFNGLYRLTFYIYTACLRSISGPSCTDTISINYKYTDQQQYNEIYRKNNSERMFGWKQEFIELNLKQGQIQIKIDFLNERGVGPGRLYIDQIYIEYIQPTSTKTTTSFVTSSELLSSFPYEIETSQKTTDIASTSINDLSTNSNSSEYPYELTTDYQTNGFQTTEELKTNEWSYSTNSLENTTIIDLTTQIDVTTDQDSSTDSASYSTNNMETDLYASILTVSSTNTNSNTNESTYITSEYYSITSNGSNEVTLSTIVPTKTDKITEEHTSESILTSTQTIVKTTTASIIETTYYQEVFTSETNELGLESKSSHMTTQYTSKIFTENDSSTTKLLSSTEQLITTTISSIKETLSTVKDIIESTSSKYIEFTTTKSTNMSSDKSKTLTLSLIIISVIFTVLLLIGTILYFVWKKHNKIDPYDDLSIVSDDLKIEDVDDTGV